MHLCTTLDNLKTEKFHFGLCLHIHAPGACFPIHARGRGSGRLRAWTGATCTPAFPTVCPVPELTYIFRRLGSFLKIPVASRTDISLSFSRLHGKQTEEVGTSFTALYGASHRTLMASADLQPGPHTQPRWREPWKTSASAQSAWG